MATSEAPLLSSDRRASVVWAGHVGADRLDEREVGPEGFGLVAPSRQYLGVPKAGVGAGLLHQAGLPHPALAHHQHEAAAAAHGSFDRRLEGRQFRAAADEPGLAIEPGLSPPGEHFARCEQRQAMVLGGDVEQVLAHLGGAAGPLLGRLPQELHDQVVQRLGDLRAVPGGGHGEGVELLRDDGDGVGPDEGRATGEALVEQGAEGVEVGSGVDVPAERLFRRHVGHRAHDHALGREAGGVGDGGEPEVTELGRAVVGQPDVGRLEVAVDDAPAVGVIERLADLFGDPDGLVDGESAVLGPVQEVVHRAARHVLADDERPAVLLADVVDGDDVGMVAESGHGLGFPADPLQGRRRRGPRS